MLGAVRGVLRFLLLLRVTRGTCSGALCRMLLPLHVEGPSIRSGCLCSSSSVLLPKEGSPPNEGIAALALCLKEATPRKSCGLDRTDDMGNCSMSSTPEVQYSPISNSPSELLRWSALFPGNGIQLEGSCLPKFTRRDTPESSSLSSPRFKRCDWSSSCVLAPREPSVVAMALSGETAEPSDGYSLVTIQFVLAELPGAIAGRKQSASSKSLGQAETSDQLLLGLCLDCVSSIAVGYVLALTMTSD